MATKRCIVVGGSSTVGRVLVGELARADTRTAFTYGRGRDVADALCAQHAGTRAAKLDLSDLPSIQPTLNGLAREMGGVDALIVCATQTSSVDPPVFEDVHDVTLVGFEKLLAVNVIGAFEAARSLAPHFDRGGNIIFFGSIDGLKPVPSPTPYAASKAALAGLALSLGKALGDKRICVNVLVPGVLESGASRTLPSDLRTEYLKHCGLRRLGRIEEVTSVARFLALENTYVTGQTITVDGGL